MTDTGYRTEGWATCPPSELTEGDHVRWRKDSRRQFGSPIFHVGIVQQVEEYPAHNTVLLDVKMDHSTMLWSVKADDSCFQKYIPWTEATR